MCIINLLNVERRIWATEHVLNLQSHAALNMWRISNLFVCIGTIMFLYFHFWLGKVCVHKLQMEKQVTKPKSNLVHHFPSVLANKANNSEHNAFSSFSNCWTCALKLQANLSRQKWFLFTRFAHVTPLALYYCNSKGGWRLVSTTLVWNFCLFTDTFVTRD